jgi:LacI family transcriptional regulator
MIEKKKVSLATIAEMSGVSQGTVSLVLNNRSAQQRISSKTVERVMGIAARLNYRPNAVAQALACKRTNTIGFICGGINTPSFSELANALLLAAEKNKYKLLLLISEWDRQKELEALNLLLDRSVDGIIMFSSSLESESKELSQIIDQGIPLVILGHIINGLNCIHFDFQPGMETAFERMLNAGVRQIGMVYDEPESSRKIQVYRDCCKKYGTIPFEYSCEPIFRSSIEASIQRGRDFAALEIRPEGVIISNDYLAGMFIRGVKDIGVRVPEDLAVVGVNNAPLAEFMDPPLTTIAEDVNTIADVAIDRIISLLEQKNSGPVHQLIESSLVERRSIGRYGVG